jgi:hypothetical protein
MSIGAFLGRGTHLVAVRYDSLKFAPRHKIVLPGGSPDGLKMLPPFHYSKRMTVRGVVGNLLWSNAEKPVAA